MSNYYYVIFKCDYLGPYFAEDKILCVVENEEVAKAFCNHHPQYRYQKEEINPYVGIEIEVKVNE